MRFEWFDGFCSDNEELIAYEKEYGISRYKCHLYDDNGKKIEEIHFYDYSTKGEVEYAEKNHYRRPYAYKVGYCHGYSMSRGFDEDKDAYNHFGWHGVKTMSVNDVKRWCENYIAEKYIINYEEELQELQKRKEVSDWFVNQGYGNLNKEDEQEMEI